MQVKRDHPIAFDTREMGREAGEVESSQREELGEKNMPNP